MESIGLIPSAIIYLFLVVMTGTGLALIIVLKKKRHKWIAFIAVLFFALLLFIHVARHSMGY